MEVVGFELTPLSFNLGSPELRAAHLQDRFQLGDGRRPAPREASLACHLLDAGPGRAVPLVANAYDTMTIFVHIETEAGVTIRTGTHAF